MSLRTALIANDAVPIVTASFGPGSLVGLAPLTAFIKGRIVDIKGITYIPSLNLIAISALYMAV